jgi:hypothetical protein
MVLTLRLAEFKSSTRPGQRVFDVYVNGMLAASGIDVAGIASWRDSAISSDGTGSGARLHDIHIELDVEHAGWFLRIHGNERYAGFFGQMNVSLVAAGGASLMPQLCALLLTRGQIKGAPQTMPFGAALQNQSQVAEQTETVATNSGWLRASSSLVVVALVSVGLSNTQGREAKASKKTAQRQRQSKQARKQQQQRQQRRRRGNDDSKSSSSMTS